MSTLVERLDNLELWLMERAECAEGFDHKRLHEQEAAIVREAAAAQRAMEISLRAADDLCKANAAIVDEIRDAVGLKGKPGSVVDAVKALRATTGEEEWVPSGLKVQVGYTTPAAPPAPLRDADAWLVGDDIFRSEAEARQQGSIATPVDVDPEPLRDAGAVAWYVFADTEHWVTLERDEADENRADGCQVRPLIFADRAPDEAAVNLAIYAMQAADSNSYSYDHYRTLAQAALAAHPAPAQVDEGAEKRALAAVYEWFYENRQDAMRLLKGGDLLEVTRAAITGAAKEGK